MSERPSAGEPHWTLLVLLCAVAVTGQVGSFLYLPALPEIAQEFVTGEAGVQTTLTAYLVGTCVGLACYGPLADRFGSRAMLAVAGFLFIATSLICAVAADLITLSSARFGQGLAGVAGIVTARATINARWPDHSRPQAMAVLSASMAVAPAASPVVGSIVLDLMDWRATFVLAAAVCGGALAVGSAALPRQARRPARGVVGDLRAIAASATFRSAAGTLAAGNAIFMVMMAGSPFLFITLAGLSPFAYSMLIAAILALFAFTAVFAGHVASRRGSRYAVRLARPVILAATAVLGLVAVLGGGSVLVAIALAVLVFGLAFVVPNSHLLAMEPFPDSAATAASISLLAATMSGAAALSLYGILAAGSVGGFAIVLAALALLSVASAAAVPAAKEQRG